MAFLAASTSHGVSTILMDPVCSGHQFRKGRTRTVSADSQSKFKVGLEECFASPPRNCSAHSKFESH